jgi:hypothetical protein
MRQFWVRRVTLRWPKLRPGPRLARPSSSATRVRSARRRHPVFPRMRERPGQVLPGRSQIVPRTVGENLRVPARISPMRAAHHRRQATGVSKAHRRETAMHVHSSRSREQGSPYPGPSPIGSASRRQPACRGTEVRTRMAIGANSLNFAVLRLPAGPALRAAMRGSVPATTKCMRSLHDQFQACLREASTMATICKRPRADDGAPVTGRAMARYLGVCRGPGGAQAPYAVGVAGCSRVLRSPGRDTSRTPAGHGRLGYGS